MRSTKHYGIKSLRDWRRNSTPQNSSLTDLQWELTTQLNTTNIGHPLKPSVANINYIETLDPEITINSVYVNVCTYGISKIDQNTYCANSIKSLQVSIISILAVQKR